MNEYLARKLRRIAFFAGAAFSEKQPAVFRVRKYQKALESLREGNVSQSILDRVNYYNKLDQSFTLDDCAEHCSELSRDVGSYYYFDLKKYWSLFPAELKLSHLLGDIIHVPDTPSIVKSRPIDGDIRNSVVLKLDKLRHFNLHKTHDHVPFRSKKSRVVWRGILNNPMRLALVNRWPKSERHDVGYIDAPRLECSIDPVSHLTVKQQLSSRYVISIEGYDVATNLKWIMASQSLCLMPKPRYETWFMEGALQAGVHYVEVRPDFEDLDEKIGYYESHPDEAEAIVANANSYCRRFADKHSEDLISVFVLQKYFERSGQLPRVFCDMI